MKKLIAVFVTVSQCFAAMNFGAANTNKVNCGTVAAINGLQSGTLLVWYKPISTANVYRPVAGKVAAGGSPYSFAMFAEGTRFWFGASRTVEDTRRFSTSGQFTAGQWAFIGATWSIDATGVTLYRGNLTTTVADVTDTATGGIGSGSTPADTAPIIIGNESSTSSLSANGDIAFVGVWNSRLSLEQIAAQQFRPRFNNGNVFFWRGATTADHGDLSGNGQTCVVTGATVANEVPLGPWFGLFRTWDWKKESLKMMGISNENDTAFNFSL